MELLGFNLIVSHLVGDYILQNDYMAKNKKISSAVCGLHAATYILPFAFCGLSAYQLVLIALQHYLQDRTNFVIWFMSKSGKSDFSKAPLAPWSIFVVDNTFHLLWIAIVVGFL